MGKEMRIWVKTQFYEEDFIDSIHIDIDKMIEDDSTIDSIVENHLEEVDEQFCNCNFNESQNYCDCGGGDWSGEYEIISKNDCIEIVDVNKLKIVIDSSIIEYEYYIKEQFFDSIGYVSFHPQLLCYCLCRLDGGFVATFAEIDKLEHIKIIDTIQENKLGLIK